MARTTATRQRLLDAGMRLFAERGFEATSVGDIETAAGLQPRRGGLYKHFISKQALLEEALRSHLDRARTLASELLDLESAQLGSGDPEIVRPLVEGLGKWFLQEFDRMEALTRLLEHEGNRLNDYVSQVKSDVVDLSYRSAAALISTIAPTTPDPEAQAVVLLGALVAVRRTSWTFGTPPLNIDDQRLLHTWATVALATIEPQRNHSRL